MVIVTVTMQRVFEELVAMRVDPYCWAREEQARGRKAVGITPMHFPEELIYASGALPVILQESNFMVTTGWDYLPAHFCAFTRSNVDAAVKGELDFLDAYLLSDFCLQMRSAFHIIERHCKAPMIYMWWPPEYNYVREVDYCSAAALALPRALFAELGGFDARFAPAYYEDTDLAFRLRAAGRSVLYQPRAVVMHLEGLSHGTDPGAGIKSFQEANRATFVRRWDQVLAAAHYPSGESVLRAREHARGRQVVLAIDHYVPQPDRDAGSCNILNYLDAMCAAGLVVKFWPQDRGYRRGYTEALQDRGIEVLHGGDAGAFEAFLAAHGGEIDHVLLSRPDVALATLGPLKRHTAARLIYYGHDLHFRRLRLQAQVTGDLQAARQAARTERIERWIWRSVDRVLYPSAEEAITVGGMEPSASAAAVPPFGFADFGAPRPPPPGGDILFVGGFAHPPNEAALLWFATEILPLVRARVPAARLVVAGSNPGPRVRALTGQGAAIHADIAPEALRALYQSARVAVAPLRYGAGVKLKTAEALREGTPLVTTAIGAQGLPGIEHAVSIAADPAGFAAAVAALLTDDALWAGRCAEQIAYARERLTIGRLHAGFLEGAGLRVPALAAAA